MVPLLRPRMAASPRPMRHDAQDIDVAALHQGWLKQAKAGGATLLTDAALIGARSRDGRWRSRRRPRCDRCRRSSSTPPAPGPTRVAQACGLAPLGMQPMRRTMAVLPAPAGAMIAPLAADRRRCRSAGTPSRRPAGCWFRPPTRIRSSRTTPSSTTWCWPKGSIGSSRRSTFRSPASSEAGRGCAASRPTARRSPASTARREGFFWLAGQGGYGIQTAPALSRLAGQLIRRAAIAGELEAIVPALSPDRFRN